MSHLVCRALRAVVIRKLCGVRFCKKLELFKFMNDTEQLRFHVTSGIKHPLSVLGSDNAGNVLSQRHLNNDLRWWDSEVNHDGNSDLNGYTKTEVSSENRKPRKIFGSSVLEDFDTELAAGNNFSWSVSDWERFEQKVLSEGMDLSELWEGVCMNMLYYHEAVHSGVALMKHIESQGRSPKLVTWTSFIALCGWHGGKDFQDLVLDSYDKLLEKFDVFDSSSCKLLIQGLSGTDRWKEAIPLLEMAKLTQQPGSGYFSPIILAALREKDIGVIMEMLDILGETLRIPQSSVFIKMAEACAENENFNFQVLFEFLRKYEWFPSTEVVQRLAQLCKRDGWRVSYAQMDSRGVCNSCGCQAPAFALSGEQFKELRDKFLERAVIRGDVFLKSTPKELKRFSSFLEDIGSCDVVLDSLNIVLGHCAKASSQKKTEVLHSAVDFFWKRGKKVLVLGRKHMSNWPQKEMAAIKQKADIFFAENQSADDPFLLYAALYSGPQTLIVSSDEMRDHRFLLGPRLGQVFAQWQRGHQVYVDAVNKKTNYVHMRMPRRFETVAQQDSGGWHIPYEDQQERFSYHRPNAWLCLRKK
ncbi:mitochondrial ribonuclease P catalytic subunit-like [Liolophura sinensis]|uniref:mitochondrial ribonuclease P catalytic subunit-like n=1 Tax=Liolophura sinensis TaxID=3198878 RepID=UPI00315984C2